MIRHFLRDDDLSPTEQHEVLSLAASLKQAPYETRSLAGPRTVATIYDKPTLRTQASFAAGIAELGGNPMLVDGSLAGIGKRESVADVARILGRQASVIVWRTYAQSGLEEMAAGTRVPVVNALSDDFHPCQLLADLLTIREHRGTLAGQTVAFVGDGASNMAQSYLLAGATAGMHVRVAAPESFTPAASVVSDAEQRAAVTGGSVSHGRQDHVVVTQHPRHAPRRHGLCGLEVAQDGLRGGAEVQRSSDQPFSLARHALLHWPTAAAPTPSARHLTS